MHTRIGFLLVIAGVCTLFFVAQGRAQTVVDTQTVGVSASVTTLPTIDTPPSGGGSGSIPRTGVRFSGLAYPGASVTLLRSNTIVLSTTADENGRFSILFTDIKEANRVFFTMYATDVEGRRSTLLNFPTVLYGGVLTEITGIRFAPTITTDKVAVKQNDFLTTTGMSLPFVPLEVVFEGGVTRQFFASGDTLGKYRVIAPLELPIGEYLVRARYSGDTRTSQVTRIIVGAASITRVDTSVNIPGDCNVDQRVTLVDFSVLAFWFGKKNPPSCVDTNKDGKINLVDFSILAFYWNG